ncbi:MAG: CorA family divalent cation transporter [Pseudomonadota bacterium]
MTWWHFDLTTPGLRDWIDSQVDSDVAAALTAPETRPRCTAHQGGLILNLRGVNLNPGADPEDMVALRLWARTDTVITVRKRRVMTVTATKDALDTTPLDSTDDLIERLTQGLVHRIETVALELEEHVDTLEDSHLEHGHTDTSTLLDLRRTLVKLRRFLGPQREALDTLWSYHRGTPLETAFHETAQRMARTLEALDAAKERLVILGDHLLAQEAARQGRNSYILGVMAAIFLPLGFLTGLFGVNVGGMPWVENASGFAIVSIASAAIGLGLYAFFKWVRWL